MNDLPQKKCIFFFGNDMNDSHCFLSVFSLSKWFWKLGFEKTNFQNHHLGKYKTRLEKTWLHDKTRGTWSIFVFPFFKITDL